MSKRDVVRLLVRLFGEPKLQDRWQANPQKVMKNAGLSKRERELLMAGDEGAIRDYLGKQSGKAVIKSGTAVIKSGAAVIKSGTAVIKSGAAVIKSGAAVIKSGTAVIKSGTAVIKSGAAVIKTSTAAVIKTSTAAVIKTSTKVGKPKPTPKPKK